MIVVLAGNDYNSFQTNSTDVYPVPTTNICGGALRNLHLLVQSFPS